MPNSRMQAVAFCSCSSSSGGMAYFLGAFCQDTTHGSSVCRWVCYSGHSSALIQLVTGPSDMGEQLEKPGELSAPEVQLLKLAAQPESGWGQRQPPVVLDWIFCCLSSQSLASANETGSRAGELADRCCGRFLSARQHSLQHCSRLLTVTPTLPLWGIECCNYSQMASMLLL